MSWLQKMLGGGRGVGPEQADGLVRSGAVLLDVREHSEWHAGHAPGACHIPHAELEGNLGALPRDRRVVAFRSGNRSVRANAHLVRSGFDAGNLNGGMQAWAAAGLPVETARAQPGTVV